MYGTALYIANSVEIIPAIKMKFTATVYLISLKNKHKQNGGDEATTFELMIADLAQWFIDNPTPAWRRQLSTAAAADYQMSYRY